MKTTVIMEADVSDLIPFNNKEDIQNIYEVIKDLLTLSIEELMIETTKEGQPIADTDKPLHDALLSYYKYKKILTERLVASVKITLSP